MPLTIVFHHSLRFSIHFVASATPSSTLSALVPWPIAVCAPGLPPAFPPMMGVTDDAHLGPSAPAFLCACRALVGLALIHVEEGVLIQELSWVGWVRRTSET